MQPLYSDSSGIGVTELLHVLDGCGLRLASSAGQLRLPLASPTLYDPWTPLSGRRSGILLGIGLHPAHPESAGVVRNSARQGFGAVVVKSLSLGVETLAAVADAEGIALIVLDDDIEWRQLDTLVGSALNSATETKGALSAAPVGDLFALANAIAAMVGGATAIEDLREQVLAYSTLPGQPIDEYRRVGILGRQVPDLPANAALYAAVFRAPGVYRLPGIPPALDRLAVAVRAGDQPLGSIWVLDAVGTLDADAEKALVRAADVAALHMLRARSAADLARQQRAELLRRVLEGCDDAHGVLGQLGMDSAGSFVVLAFQPQLASSGDELYMSRLVDVVSMLCTGYQHGAEGVLIGNTVYTLFTLSADSDLGALKSLARRLISRAAMAFNIQARASIGSAVAAAGQISRSRHDADLVLMMLAGQPDSDGTASADEVRGHLTLVELAQTFKASPRLLSPQAVRIVDADKQRGTDYALTLRTYLDLSRDSAATAIRLSLHPNTLRYRLRRASELFGLELDHSEETLTLWLSLRVMEYF